MLAKQKPKLHTTQQSNPKPTFANVLPPISPAEREALIAEFFDWLKSDD